MNTQQAVEIIKQKFGVENLRKAIPLQKGEPFKAYMTDEGVTVDNLGTEPLLPWVVFAEAINLLNQKGGKAERGNAINGRLGDELLPLDSIEGHIAQAVYGKKSGDSIFRRISPIAAILVWAGLCENAPGELKLR